MDELNIDSVISILRNAPGNIRYPDKKQPYINSEFWLALGYATSILLQAQERENPQPLTLAQLKQREGEPVWIAQTGGAGLWTITEIKKAFTDVEFLSIKDEALPIDEYGKTWQAYAHKPKEDQK